MRAALTEFRTASGTIQRGHHLHATMTLTFNTLWHGATACTGRCRNHVTAYIHSSCRSPIQYAVPCTTQALLVCHSHSTCRVAVQGGKCIYVRHTSKNNNIIIVGKVWYRKVHTWYKYQAGAATKASNPGLAQRLCNVQTRAEKCLHH